MAAERLQKVLARAGVASRRAAEVLVTQGRVRVNGVVVRELGSKADPFKDKIELDGKRIMAEDAVYVVLHKPRGVVSTMSDPEGRLTVRDLLKDAGGRVYPVGRLDFATSGVLLATNDGDFALALMHPRRQVPKTYVMKVSGVMHDRDLDVWREGVALEDGKTLPAKVTLLRHEGDKTWIELTIREGRNQQIRRMGDATGFPVMRLARVSFAGITSEGLRPGLFRSLTRDELMALRKEYGVPKRMPHAAAEEGPRASPAARGKGREPWRRRKPEGDEAGAERSTQARGAEHHSGSGGARYGGGSPGRRGYQVTEDWGGGARRGRSSGRGDAGSPEPADRGTGRQGVGRSGGSRTTGTGGGIGASNEGSYRISSTRRGRG